MDLKLYVINEAGKADITNIIEGALTLKSQRDGSASKLNFNMAKFLLDGKITVAEGDNVQLYINGDGVFSGFVFSQSIDSSGIASITAYDQLRYLKNKDTCVFEYKTAGEIISTIADSFKLKAGYLENTGYVIKSQVEDNQTLIDMILNAISSTTESTGELYVFYDDFGELTLKKAKNINSGFLLASDDYSMTEYSFKTDIDTDTYNTIKLYKDNDESGSRELFEAFDSENQRRWGILQLCEKADDGLNDIQIAEKAENMLKLKNRIKKSLSVDLHGLDNGEHRIRAGNIIRVKIEGIKETGNNRFFLIDECTHTFSENQHELSFTLYDF